MHGHLWPERGDVLGKPVACSFAEQFDPVGQGFLGRPVQALDFRARQVMRHRHGRQTRAMQDFVRVGIADAAEQARVGQRAFEGVTATGKRLRKRLERAAQHFQPSRIMGDQRLCAPDQMQ